MVRSSQDGQDKTVVRSNSAMLAVSSLALRPLVYNATIQGGMLSWGITSFLCPTMAENTLCISTIWVGCVANAL